MVCTRSLEGPICYTLNFVFSRPPYRFLVKLHVSKHTQNRTGKEIDRHCLWIETKDGFKLKITVGNDTSGSIWCFMMLLVVTFYQISSFPFTSYEPVLCRGGRVSLP